MQDLLNHTTKRICSLPQVKLENEMTNLEMLYKWGCDGSSGQSMYRMKFNDSTTENDSTVFIFSLVPLLLRCSISDENVVLWKNVRPSSTHFYRPIKFLYERETIESTKREVNTIESELKNIFPTDILLEDNNLLKIKHTLIFSMIDGKVCNSMTSTSSQSCYICECKPKNFNDIDKVIKIPTNPDNFKFGLSTLHAWIRFLECILHISYRLPFKTWKVKSDSNKTVMEHRKKEIQGRFKSEMGLLVDIVLQGHSTTNDGNTSRRFFREPEKSSDITGIDINLIKRF
ncbi:uncharacterized protein LOC112689765 [Sipha flava]|uniref:Uncharacterized protein LOC112689765 n=2 Tax=Sipha flava TaxID=143950 RepID=A0A2S2PXR4_9HEMI|nr:uncharacterized protein LOC112689765 [Sipha flava]XP_025419391.1 uncharacterized protein LOC112689765 [Sipha flava]XP_025419392.1 uncharacterized protein LOC112689765 [Sipha flava]XP_025419393.1 uncharacterized protein LOC112689765 [Sipha flava]XP_025419394.1 uncharacterized protein LOC112689765 [Sipha flava]XP_025419395.1 uncharacterized protein LOC112689765 [Sipha flava]XP_025419396.1 uncharacterized protein LOC112689765 [Sipha flava]XP_025419397.1 uncharacterized protein LOC112689765 [